MLSRFKYSFFLIAVILAMVFAGPATEGFKWLGGFTADVYAAVVSTDEGDDADFDKTGGVLKSLGFDISEMPAAYDADAGTNPYGSDVTTVREIEELLRVDKDSQQAFLFGHDTKLDGEYSSFEASRIAAIPGNLGDRNAFNTAVKFDINGDGRDEALAIIYTNYNYPPLPNSDKRIYMKIVNPATGTASNAFIIGELPESDLPQDHLIQSQLQITAGDFDKDSIDEIAVYSPAPNASSKAKVVIYDLIDGKDCEDPYRKESWRTAWNYMLPVTRDEIIQISDDSSNPRYATIVYNNIDLTSGDADNDGICDLIISYGASDTDIHTDLGKASAIERSVPSKSVLLYGSDKGQMLKNSQDLSFGGKSLIRAAFAFGDTDGDGNEDMFFGGQFRSGQAYNTSRVLGCYRYDEGSKKMKLEAIENMEIVSGSIGQGVFNSANGWDGEYLSSPLMKVNIAVGDILGEGNNAKIYMDSVIYSVNDGDFAIVDELEDSSVDAEGKPLGSQIFTDMKKGYNNDPAKNARYYEFGAHAGDFTGSGSDYVLVDRVSVKKKPDIGGNSTIDYCKEAKSSIIIQKKVNDSLTLDAKHEGKEYNNYGSGTPFLTAAVDSDSDSLVATYTGEHKIVYDEPQVSAVLAAPPYYKDAVNYDNGDMLKYCSTSYGKKKGDNAEGSDPYKGNLSVKLNCEEGAEQGDRFMADLSRGWSRPETWGYVDESEKEESYSYAGGEGAVVLHSTPKENYLYKLEGVIVADDGSYNAFEQDMTVSRSYRDVRQVLTLKDYNDIQKNYHRELPDVSQIIQSEEGYPATYPKSQNDIPQYAKERLDGNVLEKDLVMTEGGVIGKPAAIAMGKEWTGAAYGNGKETQSFSYTKAVNGRNNATGNNAAGNSAAGGSANSYTEEHDFAGSVADMPRAIKGSGYDFSWKLLKYDISYSENGYSFNFPVVTYMVDNAVSPPELPENITQDFDNTTDSQIALSWDYSVESPKEFNIYRNEGLFGGGYTKIGTVNGSDYRVKKDENGVTVKDGKGRMVKEYGFTDEGLSANQKYQYKIKAIGQTSPSESVFSHEIEAMTFAGTKPEVSLSTDKLTIYPDSSYTLRAQLSDPENYQSNISYQWQKYDGKTCKWVDLVGCNTAEIKFYKSAKADEGSYRCCLGLVRKDGGSQKISIYTEPCKAVYSLREVRLGEISTYEGSGNSATNTGLRVDVFSKNGGGISKPSGNVIFTIAGANATFKIEGKVNEAAGRVDIKSIEDKIGAIAQQNFTDGGYVITARYEGDAIFYPGDAPWEYHYLRNITESKVLSLKSAYYFGEDIMKGAGLFEYKKNSNGGITRVDRTEDIKCVKFFKTNEYGEKMSEVDAMKLAETGGRAEVPLHEDLADRALVEVYSNEAGSGTPLAGALIKVKKIGINISVRDKMTGTGDLLEFIDEDDVDLSADTTVELGKMNIHNPGEKKSLYDYLVFNYYGQNGDFMYDSDNATLHKDEFIAADYSVLPALRNDIVKKFYTPILTGGRFTVVGNYYHISASAADTNTGSVEMIAPDKLKEINQAGYAGGTKITLKAVPNKGFKVSKWMVNECGVREYTLSGAERIDYTVKSKDTEGDGKITIKAVMEPKDNILSYGVKGNGSISIEPAKISSGDTVLAGTQLKFTAVPDEGWHFVEWHWSNIGGSDSISTGTALENGSNEKTYTMPDNAAVLYAVFTRDSLDITASADLEISYINDGSDPLIDVGEEVETDRGRKVPLGTEVRVKLRPGMEIAEGAQWTVQAKTAEGMINLPISEMLYQGRAGCKFRLEHPTDTGIVLTGCSISIETVRGRYAVEAKNEFDDRADFTIYVDGEEMQGNPIFDIEAGTRIDVKAKARRGYQIEYWNVNGENVDVNDNTYSTVLTRNTIIQTGTKKDNEVSLKFKAEGGGKGKYVITDKNGDKIEEVFEGSNNTTATAYKGESVIVSAADDEANYLLTEILVNGEKQQINEGSAEIENLSEDTDIVCKFTPNSYVNLEFEKNAREYDPAITDEDGSKIEIGKILKVAKGEAYKFSVVVDKKADLLAEVRAGGGQPVKLEPLSGPVDVNANNVKYEFTIDRVEADTKVTVSDCSKMYIYNEEDLKQYFEALAKNESTTYKQPSAVLMNDINAGSLVLTSLSSSSATQFDGQGHCISGLSVGSKENCVKKYYGLFGDLKSGGYVKDVCFKDLSIYAEADADGYSGMITHLNQGIIRRVSVVESVLGINKNSSNNKAEQAGCFAMNNHGTIENCLVRGLLVENKDMNDNSLGAACGIAVFNQKKNDGISGNGVIRNNYVEKLTYYAKESTSQKEALNSVIILDDAGKHGGSLDNSSNIYKQSYGVNCTFGTNAFTKTNNKNDQQKAEEEAKMPEFTRKIARLLNDMAGEKIWGTSDSQDKRMRLIRVKEDADEDIKEVTAPIKVDFTSTKDPITRYYYPGLCDLPNAPYRPPMELYVGWVIDGVAYDVTKDSPAKVELWKDQMVEMAINPDEWPIGLYHRDENDNPFDIRYYNDVVRAMKDAEADPGRFLQELRIRGHVSMDNYSFIVSDKTSVVFAYDGSFVIGKDAQLINNGSIYFSNKNGTNKYHKYGTIENYGTIKIDINGFYNYGSPFENHGEGKIEERDRIICLPHRFGKWTYADAPETEGEHANEWKRSNVCSVCGYGAEEYIKANPQPSKVKTLEILTEPNKVQYEEGDLFSDEGMTLIANLTDGGRALVTNYDMLLKMNGEEEKELKRGDELNKRGSGTVSLKYGSLKASFAISVKNTKTQTLTLKPESLDLNIGGYGTITAAAENAGDGAELIWTVDDATTAKFYVKNEESGEMEKVNSITTKLSEDANNIAEAQVMIVGAKEGNAVVTASFESQTGVKIEKECRIAVSDSSDKVLITYNGKSISGQTLSFAISDHHITLGGDSTVENDTFTWEIVGGSSAVLEVSSSGRVTFKGTGTAAVNLISNATGARDICIIRVYRNADDVQISDTDLEMKKGDTRSLIAKLLPLDAEGTVKWSSSDESVATVTSDGKVTAVGEGSAEITAELESPGLGSAVCKVTVKEEAISLSLSGSEVKVQNGKDITLSAELKPGSLSGDIVWKSSDPSVATVSEKGVVTGMSPGTAIITASYSKKEGVSASCTVDVYEPTLTVELSKETYIYDGKVKMPKVTVKSGNKVLGSNLTSSNAEVLIIHNGENHKMPGIYTVSVVARDWHYGSGEASYVIKVKPVAIKKVSKQGNKITVRWKKAGKKNITGYKIRYSTQKSMQGAKTKTVKNRKNTRAVIGGLKGGRTYYVQVRTYVKKRGIYYYSEWSKTKTVKINKGSR